jgi:pimeloyl-ACP methyl ester carboxylesterase
VATVWGGSWAIVRAPNAGRALPEPLATLVLEPAGPPKATVFVLHGIRDRKESMTGWGGHLTGLGYRAVLVDLVGQGQSRGDFLSYGVFDARELSKLLDKAVGPIGVMGVSYGAATAIEWAAREPRLKAVVAVAPFQSLRAVVPEYFRRLWPIVSRLMPGFVVQIAVNRAGKLAGFDPDEASPLEAIDKIRAPVLLIHGTADLNIPYQHSEALHARAPASELQIVPGANHIDLPDLPVVWTFITPLFAKAFSSGG